MKAAYASGKHLLTLPVLWLEETCQDGMEFGQSPGCVEVAEALKHI